MNKIKSRIILCGKAASGKDYFRKKLQSRGLKYGISYTTRPIRNEEKNEEDYFFLSEEEFKRKIEENFFYEYISFNGWYYGTGKEQFYYKDDVFIMTPSAINKLKEEDRNSSFIIFIDIPIEIRKKRLMNRGDIDSVERRILADEKDFENFSNYDVKITNPNF